MNTPKALLPRVSQVQALDDYWLRILFKDGAVKRFDVKPFLEFPAFQRLKKNSLFFNAHVAHGTVVWDDMIDLSPDTLYLQSVEE
jgi:hypothetical protein